MKRNIMIVGYSIVSTNYSTAKFQFIGELNEAENRKLKGVFYMKKYEYKVITIPTNLALNSKQYEKIAPEFETTLNELGANGWELVQCMNGFFFFKRERE